MSDDRTGGQTGGIGDCLPTSALRKLGTATRSRITSLLTASDPV
jgi:hypothetical protein